MKVENTAKKVDKVFRFLGATRKDLIYIITILLIIIVVIVVSLLTKNRLVSSKLLK